MLNKNGNTESLEEYHSNDEVSYWFVEFSTLGYSYEYTYDENGNELTYRNSDGEKRGFETPVEKTKETKTKTMLNKNGNTENLKLYHSNGEVSYEFLKNSNNYSFEYTHDENGNQLTFKDSEGYSSEFTYDENGNELTFKNSKGVKRGFETSVEETKETKTKIMLNKNGNTEDLKEFYGNGKVSYWFVKLSTLGYSHEYTYDETGYELTFKNSYGEKRGFETPVEEGKELKETKTKIMLNKNGNTEDLKEFHSNGVGSYDFHTDSNGYHYEWTLDKNGNTLTFKNSNGYSCELTYDESGNELTYRNSDGVKRGFETPVEETKESGVPAHYDNDNGSLYLIAEERGWSSYLFDIVKRLERSGKKGEFESDLNKSKVVIDIWLKESKLKERDNVK